MAHPIFLAALLLAAEITAPVLPRVDYPPAEVRKEVRHRVDAKLTLEMKVAADGLLTEVRLVEQENIPAGSLDGAVEFFRSQLEGKRARPAEREGVPVAVTYRYIFVWPLYYPPPEVHNYPEDLHRNGQLFEDLPDLPKVRLRLDAALPVPKVETPDGRRITVEQFRDELDARARVLMGGEAARETRQGPLVLLSDEPDLRMVDFCVVTLKAVPVEFVRVFRTLMPEAPAVPAYHAYLFHRPHDLVEFQAAMGIPRWADGAYLGTLRVLSASTGQGHLYRVREVLIHEQVHALVHELLLPHAAVPAWLNEGLAEVFAGSRIADDGRMTFGTVDRKQALDRRSGKVWTPSSRIHLAELWDERTDLKGKLVPAMVLDRWTVGEGTPEPDIRRFYAAAWGLTRFLLGDDPVHPTPAFLDYLRDLREDRSKQEAFVSRFGPLEEVDRAFWKALRKW